MYDLELHYQLAKLTLFLLLAATITGIILLTRIMQLLKIPPSLYKWLRIAHIITGILTLLFFLLTYFLVPKI